MDKSKLHVGAVFCLWSLCLLCFYRFIIDWNTLNFYWYTDNFLPSIAQRGIPCQFRIVWFLTDTFFFSIILFFGKDHTRWTIKVKNLYNLYCTRISFLFFKKGGWVTDNIFPERRKVQESYLAYVTKVGKYGYQRLHCTPSLCIVYTPCPVRMPDISVKIDVQEWG